MLQQHPILSIAFFFKTLFLLIVFLILSAEMRAMPTAFSKEQQAIDDSVRKTVIQQLVADGLIASENHPVYFFVLDDEIETNGHTLRGDLYEKYLTLLQSFQLEEIRRWGFYRTENQLIFQGIVDRYDHYHFIQHYESIAPPSAGKASAHRAPAVTVPATSVAVVKAH